VTQTPNIAASNPIGTIMMIDNGKVRLSYCGREHQKHEKQRDRENDQR